MKADCFALTWNQNYTCIAFLQSAWNLLQKGPSAEKNATTCEPSIMALHNAYQNYPHQKQGFTKALLRDNGG